MPLTIAEALYYCEVLKCEMVVSGDTKTVSFVGDNITWATFRWEL